MVQTLRRYLRLLRVQLRMSATTAMQYRTEFLLKGALALFWIAVTLVPLFVVFSTTGRSTMFGWTYERSLVVLAWFTLLKAILEGGVTPSLLSVVEGVRNGALDFVLLKPADAQFMVSTSKFEPWRVVDFLGAAAIFAYAFQKMGRWPTGSDVMKAALLLLVAVLLLYSIWILVVSAAFWVVRMDNLSYLFQSIFDAGRWPIDAFRSPLLKGIFTYVFPLALMTTFPAKALLGTLGKESLSLALVGGVGFAVVARLVWTRAVRFYTSASS
jgi:ABC-2 type transport system permease protein